jgi:hypothetical protein
MVGKGPNGCWYWYGCKTKKSYGRFWYDGQTRWAHRIAYVIFVGDIPELMTVDHECHNPACCRPDHLRLVSYENNLKLKVHKHDWVLRTDDYQEQCTPAICAKCGKYGCLCDVRRDLGHQMDVIESGHFHMNGMAGNDHELEKSLCK